MTRRRVPAARGFSLMELMVAMVVVAVLAAIAYPAYTEAMHRGWRAEARTALMQEMQQQERHYTQNASYRRTVFSNDSGTGGSAGSGKYMLSVAPCDGTSEARHCIRLVAALRPGLSDPQVQDLWLDSRGAKGCSGTGGSSSRGCWP